MAVHQGVKQKLQEHLQQGGIQVHFKGGNTIKYPLVDPKDRDNITQKRGVIYRYKCERLNCDEKYIEESASTF